MKKPERVRSVLEYYLGEKLPESWEIEAEDGFYSVRNSKGRISFRERDMIRRVHIGESVFLLGLENQETVNLIYPWRLMEMDCLAYRDGIERIQERNKAKKVRYGKGDDFKYCYRKTDRLEPVLNLTLYWGKEEWRKPLTLGHMMKRKGLPDKLWELFDDYKVHIIPMRQIPEEDLQKMDSDLRYVLGIMKCAGSRKRYMEYIEENKGFFSRVPRSALDVIDACGGIGDIGKYLEFTLDQMTGEEEADMCKAVRDIERYAEQRGKKKGRKEGRREGIEQGIRQGAFEMLCELVRDGLLQLSEAAGRADLSEAAFREKMQAAGYRAQV